MACHHGNGPRQSKGSEYSTWIAVDPHAKAYRTLFKPESKRMHANLSQHDDAYKKYRTATDNPLCLKCHGMGDGVPKAFHADGVGCERCHGPAEHWKSTHYLDGFDRTTKGFVDTRDLVERARTCMKCHVGDSTQEVNHDLIAAGHPRLRFEFAAYLANYPKHWADTGEKRADPGFEARAWVVGQLVSAQAALELLASRTKGKDPITKEAKPWPEFAEYECAACHHGLKDKSERQEKYPERLKANSAFRAGELPWGTWYTSVLPAIAARSGAERASKLEATRKQLVAEMGKRLPNRDKVVVLSREMAAQLQALRDRAKAEKMGVGKVNVLMKTLAGEKAVVQSGWDGGAQVYLGLAAMHHARSDLVPGLQDRSSLKVPLVQMRRALENSFGKTARPLYDSPLDYQSGKLVEQLKVIRSGLK
jgi:hypothetical protein